MGLLGTPGRHGRSSCSGSRFRSRTAMIDSLAWAQGGADSLKTGQPPAVHTQLPSGRFAGIYKPFRTRVHNGLYTAKTWHSRPRFSRVGCDALWLVPAPLTPEAAVSSPVDPANSFAHAHSVATRWPQAYGIHAYPATWLATIESLCTH